MEEKYVCAVFAIVAIVAIPFLNSYGQVILIATTVTGAVALIFWTYTALQEADERRMVREWHHQLAREEAPIQFTKVVEENGERISLYTLTIL